MKYQIRKTNFITINTQYMATRSTISIETSKGIRSVYCHYDGYLSHNGKLLKENYNTEEKVNALIDLGDLSQLGESLESTVAYHRDRKESLYINECSSLESLDGQDYNYLFRNGEWVYWRDSYKDAAEYELPENEL
jgi:hypothetical protein